MLRLNKTMILIICLIFISAVICGCSNDNSNISEQSLAFLQANAPDETSPTTEIIAGTVSLSTTESTTISVSVTENTTEYMTYTTENTESANQENLYVVTPSGKKYHYDTCHNAKNVYKYLTKEEAEQLGYQPCKTCKPK